MNSTFPMTTALILAMAIPSLAADLRVTDSTGVEVLVRDAAIDYSGLLGSDREMEGVRVYQGEALITANWADIASLTVTGRDSATSRLTIDIGLKDGKKVAGQLLRKGRMKLTGMADLGEYSIDLEKIQKITVISAK